MTLGDDFLGPDAVEAAGPLEECSVWGESCFDRVRFAKSDQ